MQFPTFENVVPPGGASPVKPPAFQKRYLALQPIPYSFLETSGRTSSTGGVLRSGQCVWLDDAIQRNHRPKSVQAFVESIGLVLVDPRWLKKGDGSF
jgi:hypothetical protein